MALIPMDTSDTMRNSTQIVPISEVVGFGFSGVGAGAYLAIIASLGVAEKFI